MHRRFIFCPNNNKGDYILCGRGRGLPPCGQIMGRGRRQGFGMGSGGSMRRNKNIGGCEIGGPGYGRGGGRGMGKNRQR